MADPFVYFIRPIGMKGPIKIGRSIDAEARLSRYSNLSPFPLEIAAKVAGDYGLEASFHTLFARHHGHHEWFHAAPEIDAVIDAIHARSLDVGKLPRGKRLGYATPRWSAKAKLAARLSRRIGRYERLRMPVPPRVVAARRQLDIQSNAEIAEAFLAIPCPKAA